MRKIKKIIVVDDNRGVLSAMRLLLRSRGYEVETFDDPAIVSAASLADAAVVVLDMNYKSTVNNGNEGFYWLSRFLSISPSTPVVLMTAFAEISLAVRGIKEGAADFIVKPWDNNKLIEVIEAAISNSNVKESEHQAQGNPMIWGGSAATATLLRTVEKAAPTDANILIFGENGTGKGMLAQEIHSRSLRKNAAFTTIDVGALPESLFESELFGYAKGAFTGAAASRPGKIESASSGTLFIDEIGNLPLHLQSKLLTVLQSRQVVRLGENTPRAVDVRLICATNRNLEKMVASGEFREDLFYRINTIAMTLAPLRERPEEISLLAKVFVKEFARQYSRDIDIDDSALAKLKNYPWPGNIRQLRHAIEKGVIMCDNPILTASDFNLETASAENIATRSTTIAEMEKSMIAQAMADCGGNLSAVAARLGITRQTLYNKIHKMGL
ncbi:MAG: sigma-54-dependent Fis family transcriptional regulator [Muribaculaceae bacterium]|nr:sigma-54-dependent Fis family transcriptional regulator [Muribaculaceae bacterium]